MLAQRNVLMNCYSNHDDNSSPQLLDGNEQDFIKCSINLQKLKSKKQNMIY
jgi:hypothetical protein